MIECEADPMIQLSFFKNQWSAMMNKWPCLTFTCPTCREDIKTKEDIVMSSRVRLLEENAFKTNKQLENILTLLTTEKATSEEKPITYRDIAAKEPPMQTPSLIVVEKSENDTTEETKSKVSEITKAAIKSKVQMKKSFTNKAGHTVFVCNSDKSKEALLPHVQQVFTTRTIKTPKPKLPTVTVPFIRGKYENEDLLEVLRLQNEDCGIMFSSDNTQVLFSAPMKEKPGLFKAVIRVSEDIRKRIKTNGNRLFVGETSCPVYDRFFVKRCARCQSFHHFINDDGGCKKAQVCALCTGNHDTRTCRTDEDQYKCVNCFNSNKDEFSHATFSPDCACYIEEQEKIRKSINYYNTNQIN